MYKHIDAFTLFFKTKNIVMEELDLASNMCFVPLL